MGITRVLNRDMLGEVIEVQVEGEELDFVRAREIADAKVRERVEEPMLMAWFDRATGEFSPNVECCSEEKPGWLVYAESRGGNVIVDINDEQYVFVYREY